jgi:tRNA pseudouridine55 synthase
MTICAPPARIVRRRIDGILLVDKPEGLSSNQVLGRVKYLYRAAKGGHSGTLDPMATGLLPILLGEATKFSQLGLDANKEYEATVMLGVTTTTGDLEGEPVAKKAVTVSNSDLPALVQSLQGEQDQMPPMFSALKHAGKPLYDYARRGIEVERKARRIVIYEAELLETKLPVFRMRISCSKGTYIRSLAETLGERAGCGAHLVGLRRTRSGDLSLAKAVSLDRLSQETPQALQRHLLPVDHMLQAWPRLQLSQDQTHKFRHGQAQALATAAIITQDVAHMARPSIVTNQQDNQISTPVRVYSQANEFLGIASWKAGLLQPERVIVPASYD